MLKLGIDLKLPIEWIQMFRTLLSIYLSWLILLSPRKPLLKDNVINKLLFVGILFVFAQSDMVSCILLMMIYFLSFQPILPMMNEYFFENRPISNMIDENLRRTYEYVAPTPTPIVYNFYEGIMKKDLLKI
jgi:hypothetical protein